MVKIGENICNIKSIDNEEIVCNVETSNQPELLTSAKITLSNLFGYAGVLTENTDHEFIALLPAVTSLGDITEGSLNGGSRLEILGFGLNTEGTQVLFDGFDPCVITEQSYTELICLTPKFNTGDPSNSVDGTRDIRVFGNFGEFENLVDDAVFSYLAAKTPTIDLFEVVGGNTYTLSSRKKRSVNGDVIVAGTVLRFNLNGVTSGSDVEVYLNDVLCESTGTPGECRVTEALSPGTVTVRISDEVYGDVFISDSLNLVLTAPSKLTSVQPDTGSLLGGQTITVTGTGFSDLTVITINGAICTTVSYTTSEFICITPESTQTGENALVAEPEFDNSIVYNYEESGTPEITSLSVNQALSDDVITVYGKNLGSTVSGSYIRFDGVDCAIQSAAATSLTCQLGAREGGPVNEIEFFINEYGHGRIDNSAINFKYQLSVESISIDRISTAGGAEVIITGVGFSASATVELCEIALEDVEVVDQTTIKFIAPPSENLADAVCEIEVFNTDASAVYRYLRYASDVMPTITGVSPDRGGTAGGTIITITGTGFRSITQPQVMISTAECLNLEIVSDSTIKCMTAPLTKGSPQYVKIQINSATGVAQNEETHFWYIDRWNSKYTWGGTEPPIEGDMAVIDKDQTILMDGSTAKLKMLLIDGGHLIFDPTVDCHIQAENILITNGGSVTAGTEAEPYEGNIKIEMFGKVGDLELPVYGAKTMAVRDGLISLHGKKAMPVWTTLEQPAEVGTTFVVIDRKVGADDFNWQVGQEIVITTTGRPGAIEEEENRIITNIEDVSGGKKKVHFAEPLEYLHLGSIETLENGKTLDMRAEVGMLSRNIVFTGDDHTDEDGFGACMMCGPSKPGTLDEPSQGNMRLSNIVVQNAGQVFRLSRYPVHFHFLGHQEESFIKNSVVRHTHNRAIVVHHTDSLKVDNNVVTDIKGGAIFIEDGIERFNEITNNLVTNVQVSSSLQLDDLTPASIWVTNPNNICNNNRVAGSAGFGIWYRMHEHPEAGSFTSQICQQHEPLGECKDNVIHSVEKIGLWTFENFAPFEGSGLEGSCRKEVPLPAKFENTQVYRCDKGIEFFDAGALHIIGGVVAECEHAGIEWKRLWTTGWDNEEKGALIKGVTVVGRTPNYIPEINVQTGLIIPAQSGLLVDSVDFIEFGDESSRRKRRASTWTPKPSRAVGGTLVQCIHQPGNGGFESRFKNIGWYSTTVKAHSRWFNDIQIRDLDGSFSQGAAGQTVMSDVDSNAYTNLGCTAQATDGEYQNGMTICPNNVQMHHFRLLDIQQDSLKDTNIVFKAVLGKLCASLVLARS